MGIHIDMASGVDTFLDLRAITGCVVLRLGDDRQSLFTPYSSDWLLENCANLIGISFPANTMAYDIV